MYDLNRFLSAQRRDYAAALREIRSGRKRSHWIWYIFPQVAGLGMSSTSRYFPPCSTSSSAGSRTRARCRSSDCKEAFPWKT